MAYKTFQLGDLGAVTIYKRRGARSMRLSVRADGSIRLTLPPYVSYESGMQFVQSKGDWLRKHAVKSGSLYEHGQPIGKAHHLAFVSTSTAERISTRIRESSVVITHPAHLSAEHDSVQQAARTAAIRALRKQAEALLPNRLASLAQQHGFRYRSVTIKQLKSRWGSCDQNQNIALNLYLMTLPWELIDYVLLHELTHTRIMQHGPKFWQAMEALDPRTPAHRRAIREHRPAF